MKRKVCLFGVDFVWQLCFMCYALKYGENTFRNIFISHRFIAVSSNLLLKTIKKPKYTRVEEPETEIPSTDNKDNPLVTHIHSYSDDHISQRAPKMHSTPTHMIRKTCASTINRASTVFIELKGKNNAHII